MVMLMPNRLFLKFFEIINPNVILRDFCNQIAAAKVSFSCGLYSSSVFKNIFFSLLSNWVDKSIIFSVYNQVAKGKRNVHFLTYA